MRKPWSVGHELHNNILCRWCNGESLSKISKAVGLCRNRISLIVCKARERGDFRAVHHFEKDGQVKGRYRHRAPKASSGVHSPISASLAG